jgi:aconitate hydratase
MWPSCCLAAALGKITDQRNPGTCIHEGPLKSIKIVKGDANCQKGGTTRLVGTQCQSLPLFEALPDTLEVPILLKWEMIFLSILKAGAGITIKQYSGITNTLVMLYYPTFYDQTIEKPKEHRETIVL